jgi:hypothetical protein
MQYFELLKGIFSHTKPLLLFLTYPFRSKMTERDEKVFPFFSLSSSRPLNVYQPPSRLEQTLDPLLMIFYSLFI